MTNRNILVDARVRTTTDRGEALVGPYFKDVVSGGNRKKPLIAGTDEDPHYYSRQLTAFLNVLTVADYDVGVPPNQNWKRNTSSVDSGLGTGSPTFGWTTAHDTELFRRLKEEVMSNDFNVLTTMGEFHKTCEMIAYSARRLAYGGMALRRLDFRALRRMFGMPNRTLKYRGPPTDIVGVKGVPRDLSQIWLEYSYGWRPLIKDVYDGAQKLSDYVNRPQLKRYVARLRVKGYADLPNRVYGGPGAYSRGQLIAFVESSSSEPYLPGVMNPAVAAWDLLPYSFVVDWFLPVSTYLNTMGLNAVPGLKWLVKTRKDVADLRGCYPTSKRIRPISGFDAYRFKQLTVTRTVGTTWNIPVPKMAKLQDLASVRRAISAAALLISAFGQQRGRSPYLLTHME